MNRRIVILMIILIFLLALVFFTIGENTGTKTTSSNVAHLELVVLPGQAPQPNMGEGSPRPAGGG